MDFRRAQLQHPALTGGVSVRLETAPWPHVMDVDLDGTGELLARVAHGTTIRPIN